MKRAILDEEKTSKRSTNLLKIGEVSKHSGIGIEALRFYERSGLLNRPARTYSGYRVYDESILERLAFIKKLRHWDSHLMRLKELLMRSAPAKSPVKKFVRS